MRTTGTYRFSTLTRVTEEPFAAGPLRGHRRGSGPPALLLHGEAAVPDYLGSLADELVKIARISRLRR